MVDTVFKYIRKAELLVCSVVFMSSLVVLFANVFTRSFGLGAITWGEEFMRYAIIWVTFFGCALCAEDDLHVGIDIFIQMSPLWLRKVLKIFGMACATFFCAYMVEFSFRNTMLLMTTGQKTPIMLLPMWIVYISMPIGMFFTTLRFGRKLINYIRMKPIEFADKKSSADDIDMLTLN